MYRIQISYTLNPRSPEGVRYRPQARFLAITTKRKELRKTVKTYSSMVQFRMLWRFPRKDSSFQYLERPGKPRAPSMEKSEIFCWSMLLKFPATYRHYSNGYPHIFDHGRPDHDDVDVARHCWLRIQDGGRQTGTKNNFWMVVVWNAIPKAASCIFDHARFWLDTEDTALCLTTLTDIGRRWQTTKIQDGGQPNRNWK